MMLTGALEESKTDVITGRILIELLTIGELTRKSKAKVDKIVELDSALAIDVPDSGAKEGEGYSSVNEVVETSIRDTYN